MMGPNTYTLQNGLSISSTTGWTIMGLKARSKLTVKNGLNTAMLTLNSTTDFAMRDVFADGNYTESDQRNLGYFGDGHRRSDP